MGVRPIHCPRCKSKRCSCNNTIRFNPTIEVNPVINISPAPVNGNGGQGLLTEFQVDQPLTTTVHPGIQIPGVSTPSDLPTDGLEIATISVNVDNISSRVWMTGTVGWSASSGVPDVVFAITRTRPAGTEELIFTTEQEGESPNPDTFTSSFTFVDETPILTQGPQLVQYRLRVGTLDDNAYIRGPIILTGAEIRANTP
ncbi:hypothetical protein ACFPU1_12840 [Thalassorhabdus alkalitolerans]|uniref:Uncharacterized protein n=1 Tax=Thalassorhabdus alkalitolerans TaxID=2282697 RepID=A0ABW0YNE0_9BACI